MSRLYDSKVARLGSRRWHIVRAYAPGHAVTACGNTLFDGYLGEYLEYKNGEPTCKHCLGWWKKQG